MTFVAGVWHLSNMCLLLSVGVLIVGTAILGLLLNMWMRGLTR